MARLLKGAAYLLAKPNLSIHCTFIPLVSEVPHPVEAANILPGSDDVYSLLIPGENHSTKFFLSFLMKPCSSQQFLGQCGFCPIGSATAALIALILKH